MGTEIALIYDIDEDGMTDVLYGDRDAGIVFAGPDRANPAGPGPMSFKAHGLAAGDVNGDLVGAGAQGQPAGAVDLPRVTR